MDHSIKAKPATIRRRRVHYISGFDPRGATHYHRLYRDEARLQEKHGQLELDVGRRQRKSPKLFSWNINGKAGENTVQTDYQFMVWDDLVRQVWEANLLRLIWSGLPIYWGYLLCGGIKKTRQSSRNAYLSCVFPPVFILLLLSLTTILLLLGTPLLAAILPDFFYALSGSLLLGAAFVWGSLKLGDKLGVFWVMRTTIFIYLLGVRPNPGLDQRTSEIAQHILQAQADDPVDEVLIVGHSVGSILAVSVVAKLLRGGLPAGSQGVMSLLTLGECMPYLVFTPKPGSFCADLATVAADTAIPWLDVTSPPDPLCFHLVDPVLAAGLDPVLPNRPLLLNARIFKMYRPETYKKIRRNKFQIHFQYLRASELPSDYDYFYMTAGPERLADLRKR